MIFIFFPLILLPFYYLKIQTGVGSLMILDVAVGTSFMLWVVVKKFFKKNTHNPLINHRALFVGVLFFILGIFFATLQSEAPLAAIGRVKSWFLVPLLFYFMLYDYFVTYGERAKQAVLMLYTTTTAYVALAATYSYVITYDGRLAFFGNPNYLAFFIAPAFVVALFGVCSSKKLWQRWFYSISLGILFVPLFLTFSYSAWFGVVVACATILHSFISKQWWKRTLWFAGFLILLLFLMNQDKFLNLFQERSSLLSRVEIWRAAFSLIYSSHGFGIGFGGFEPAYLSIQKMFPPYLHWAVLHAHNTFIHMLVEAGILGLAGLIVVVWFTLTTKAPPAVRLLLRGFVVYFFCVSLFDTLYFKNDLALVFWLFVALAANTTTGPSGTNTHLPYLQRK